jgi:hypothetical protein
VDIIGRRGNQEGEDIIGRRGNQEGVDITGVRGNQEGEDIIGKQRKTTNDCPGEIIECQIPLGCVRFSSVASDNIYHVLSVRYGIVISVMCLGLRSLKRPDRDYRQPTLR